MFRVQLRPVSQQQNSTIFRPVATAFSPMTGVQSTSLQSQGFASSNQLASSNQIPATSQLSSVAQSFQIPTTTLTSGLGTTPWTQTTMVNPWQQSNLYTQAYQPISNAYQSLQTSGIVSPFLQSGQMMLQQPYVVQGISHNIVQPKIDISETNSEIVLSYDLPLVDQNNLNLSVSHDSVTLQANSGQGIFYRTVTLPTDVYPDSAEASLTNEILEIRIPKASQSRRKVNINQQDINV